MPPMRVKLVTFRYSATLGGFDDTALVDFTRNKEVISLREHFYFVNDTPHLTCIVTYQDAIVPRESIEAARIDRGRARDRAASAVERRAILASRRRARSLRRNERE